ncbi:Aspyridones efflux protein [Vanrija pseudolonga]|uniref:Aspyridones efflux protein n=1 Tax=Vanrija pseudolonga TaxID=143232 RepID=A0AAF1BQQ6_9TREE|nr:Aspyridones efflux protein [Vanrija pseudolonga]
MATPAGDAITLTDTPSKHGSVDLAGDRDEVKSEGAVEATADGEAAAPVQDQSGVLHGMRLFLVFLAMMLSVFSIVATAIPIIVSDFNAFAQVSWIITAYFLTQCGFILLVGQLLTVIKPKYVLLGAIFFFELGSLLCALANGMIMLIVARAIQGIGASGMFVSIIAIIAVVTAVEKRAMFMSGFGFIFVISSVIGPLLGGVFTEHLSWRWCFWINLPVGGVAAAAVVFLLPARSPEQRENAPKTWGETLRRMDWIGSALVILFITCLLLALQWGGNNYKWSNWRIPVLFTIGGLLVIAFFLWEWYLDHDALIPMSILTNRTILACSGSIFMFMMAMLGGTYQLPLYYQAGRGHSAQKSGIDIIPFMIIVCVGIFVSGGFVTKFGHYYPFLLIGPPSEFTSFVWTLRWRPGRADTRIAAVGFGLLFTIRENTSNAKVIGYQILSGFGIGLTFQNIILAAQAEYTKRPALIPQATGVVSFFQLTGAAIGKSFMRRSYLKEFAPDAPFDLVRQSTSAIYEIDPSLRPGVIHAYILAISKSYMPIFIAIGLALIIGAFIRAHNMNKIGASVHAVA